MNDSRAEHNIRLESNLEDGTLAVLMINEYQKDFIDSFYDKFTDLDGTYYIVENRKYRLIN